MSEIATHFNESFPADMVKSVSENYRNAEWLCPLWVHRVVFTHVPDAAYVCEANIFKDYREVYINISNHWLLESPQNRRLMMIHELIHCFTVPLKTAVCEALEDLGVDDDRLEAIIYRQINRAMEAVTQDFAYVIDRKMTGLYGRDSQ